MNNINKEILRLSVPNVISNISVPLLGMADTAISGRILSDAGIAALAMGTTIMNMVYWNCAFLRMGSSGMTSQAYGAGDFGECKRMLVRALAISMALSALILCLRTPICSVAFGWMSGEQDVAALAWDYVTIRFWAVPATVALFGVHGWFIGMQDSKSPMIVAIVSNVVNVAISAGLAFGGGMGLDGVAWGTVVAQYIALGISVVLYFRKHATSLPTVRFNDSFEASSMKRIIGVNVDIFLRTLCVVIAYSVFTIMSSRLGSTELATNTLLMMLFTFFSYLIDGVAYAAESLSGRFVGAKDYNSFGLATRKLLIVGLWVSVIYSLTYAIGWRSVLGLFGPTEVVLDCAGRYVWWCVLIPIVGFYPFVVDGIMIGATRTRALRDTVALALVCDLGIVFGLNSTFGNDAVWLGFVTFILLRGVLLMNPLRHLESEMKK